MADQINTPINYPVIAGGKIVVGGKVLFGNENQRPDEDNPATLKAIFVDSNLTIQAQNPQPLGSNGEFDQSVNGTLYGPDNAVYSVLILNRKGKELSYTPSFNLSDTSAATSAAASAAAAAASESNAAASESAAADIGIEVANSYVDFVNRYFGAFASDPSVDPAGNPPNEGSIYFNTVSDVFFTWNGSAWINYFPSNPNGLLVTATGTTTPRTLGDRFADVITPLDKGAVGDGVADDTAAIVATIQDGRPVDWLNLTYGITGISETVVHDIRWRSNGAAIKNISTTAIGRTIELFIGANTVNISGELAIDANDKSYIGFRIENTSESKSTLIAEDLTCINAFRSGTDFVGGSGLNIKGWFERVHLTRPTIKNCHLGAGAGISGIVGISGILVEPKSTTPFQAVEKFYVEDPHIEDVYSDDLLYVIDQDGINFRTASDDPTYDLPWPTDFNVLGGVFKNCWGRSIKCQSENGNIEGSQFIRTTGNEHNGSEIDFQVGAGSVSNIKCIYEAFTPNWVVTLSGARRVDKLVPFGSVSGVKVSVAAGETINAVVNCANREFTRQSWVVRDVNVRGATDYIVRLTGGTNATNILSLSDVTVDTLNEYGVWTGVNSFSSDSKCIIKRVFHAGLDVPLMRASAATSPLLSSEDCFGFTEITKVDQEGSGDVGSFLRVDKIAPLDSKESGFLKPFSFLMANNDIVSLPIVGYNSGSNMAILSVSSNKQGKAIITYDTGSATKITSEGTNFETGTTTEPVTGSFRLWVSGGTLQISNRSGTQRMLTGLMIG